MDKMMKRGAVVLTLLAIPALTGAKGCGGEDNTVFSKSPAPSMAGTWDVSYDDVLDVEITIGGSTYTEQLGAAGGVIDLTHDGHPLTFDLNCSREEVVCPSEVWPAEVSFRQDNPTYPHRVWLLLPTQECDGNLVAPDPSECGPDTNNPDCEDVCDGEVITGTAERFGTIDEQGESWSVGLGVGIASNGVNCLLLGGSYAEGDLTTTGSAEEEDWEATATSGDVTTIYTGGCLWAGDPNMDGELEALVLGAAVKFVTGFDATKQ